MSGQQQGIERVEAVRVAHLDTVRDVHIVGQALCQTHVKVCRALVFGEGDSQVGDACGTASDEDARRKPFLVGRDVMVHVGNNLFVASLHNLLKLFLVLCAVEAQVDLLSRLVLAVGAVSRAVLLLQRLCFLCFHLEAGDVARHIGAAQRDDAEMAQDVVLVDGHRRRVGTDVDQRTACTLLAGCEQGIRQTER